MSDDTMIVPLVMTRSLRDAMLKNGGSEAIVPMELIPNGDGFEMVMRRAPSDRWAAFTDDELTYIYGATMAGGRSPRDHERAIADELLIELTKRQA